MPSQVAMAMLASQGRDQSRMVTVSEAARLLGVNKSTVSRQVGRLYPNHGDDKKPLLDIEEVRAARAAQLNTAMRRGEAAAVDAARPAAVQFEEDPAPAGSQPAPTVPAPVGTMAFWQTEKVKEQALLARAAREEQAGRLVERQAVDDAAFEFGRMLTDYLGHLGNDMAVQLASMTDTREIAVFLDGKFRTMLERLAAELERQLGPKPEAEAGVADAAE